MQMALLTNRPVFREFTHLPPSRRFHQQISSTPPNNVRFLFVYIVPAQHRDVVSTYIIRTKANVVNVRGKYAIFYLQYTCKCPLEIRSKVEKRWKNCWNQHVQFFRSNHVCQRFTSHNQKNTGRSITSYSWPLCV